MIVKNNTLQLFIWENILLQERPTPRSLPQPCQVYCLFHTNNRYWFFLLLPEPQYIHFGIKVHDSKRYKRKKKHNMHNVNALDDSLDI